MTMNAIQTCLEKYKVHPQDLLSFGEDAADLLPYATITNAQKTGDEEIKLVEAVYEWQFSPLIAFVDGSQARNEKSLNNLRHKLAMRGDIPYLGLVLDKGVEVFQIGLDKNPVTDSKVAIDDNFTLLANLGNCRPVHEDKQRASHSVGIADVILKLLTESISELNESKIIPEMDCISLVGRALFSRFLADRGLIPRKLRRGHSAGDLRDRDWAKSTSMWLDDTFNGDFLQLSEGVFEKLNADSYRILGDIQRKEPDGQGYLGWEEKWEKLDFSHIPVGILGQVFESYLGARDPDTRKNKISCYTPNQITNIMVKATVRMVKKKKNKRAIKILDPSAGTGVFLIAAFRELVAARWEREGNRPDTKALRDILDNQITGFEVDESAVRFAALGLYLISIELDSNLNTTDCLKFNNLQGSVLHCLKPDGTKGSKLGSLNPTFGKGYRRKYDIVIGNPLRSQFKDATDWELLQDHVSSIANDRQVKPEHVKVSPANPDIPFLWRSLEWAKKDGQIALTLHARWQFQQSEAMKNMRNALVSAIDFNSIVNCSKLRKTEIWPNVTAPFCVIFAQNRIPHVVSGFRFVIPGIDKELNDSGNFRLDVIGSEYVTKDMVVEIPYVLKIFSIGSSEDLQILERIDAKKFSTLKEIGNELKGVEADRKVSGSGAGVRNVTKKYSTSVKGGSFDGPKSLIKMPDISNEDWVSPVLNWEPDHKFRQIANGDVHQGELVEGPVLLVRNSPHVGMIRILASMSFNDVHLGESAYGYSMKGVKDGEQLLKFLCLILRSKIALWQILLRSSWFGIEDDAFQKSELDELKIPDFRTLTKPELKEVSDLFDALKSNSQEYEAIDNWVAKLYGLSRDDLSVISDTLDYSLPFATNMRIAQGKPSSVEIERFCGILKQSLSPLTSLCDDKLEVKRELELSSTPWECLNINLGPTDRQSRKYMDKAHEFKQMANSSMSSDFFVEYDRTGLFVGILSQKRYWSESSAHSLARKILWSDLRILN